MKESDMSRDFSHVTQVMQNHKLSQVSLFEFQMKNSFMISIKKNYDLSQ